MRKLGECRRVRPAWLVGEDTHPEPAVGQHVVDVACQLADRIERQPAYATANARRDNAVGWTVRLLSLGSPCRHEERAGIRLMDDELRRAMVIARRIVISRRRTL